MKNNDSLFSDIQNLCNAVSDWLIKIINNPIETKETISCACCHIVCDQDQDSLLVKRRNDNHSPGITAEPVKFDNILLTFHNKMFRVGAKT